MHVIFYFVLNFLEGEFVPHHPRMNLTSAHQLRPVWEKHLKAERGKDGKQKQHRIVWTDTFFRVLPLSHAWGILILLSLFYARKKKNFVESLPLSGWVTVLVPLSFQSSPSRASTRARKMSERPSWSQ
jgi:hypothetical protein